jgi:hypothetical protein
LRDAQDYGFPVLKSTNQMEGSDSLQCKVNGWRLDVTIPGDLKKRRRTSKALLDFFLDINV